MTNSTRCTLLAKQACTTLSQVVQKITPPSANNFLKLFFALFAMLALGVGNAWAETESLACPIGTISNNTMTWELNSCTIVHAKGTNSNYAEYNPWRVYQGAIVTFTPKANISISKIVITAGSSAYATAGATTWTNATATASSSTITVTPTDQTKAFSITASAQTRWSNIEITYTSAGSEPPTPPTTYTIKWHTAVGTTTDVTLNEGATITEPATDPAMTGYEFMGWTEDCSVASDGSDFTALTDFGTADSDKDFYAVFAVATTTGGGAATETTASVVIKDYASAKNWANGTKYNTVEVDANITATVTGGANTGKYYTSGNEWRLYQTESPTLTISAKNDLNIKTVKVTYNVSNSGVLKLNSSYVTSGTVKDVNASSITFSVGNTNSATNGQVKVTAMEVVYTSGGGGTTTYSDYITTCASGIEYVELGDAFKWSATEAEVTIDATDNEFPALTNTHNVPVTYSSSDDAIASIASDGTVTLNKEGTVTITAKYAGGTSAGTGKEYKAKTVTYSLKVNKAAPVASGTTYVKVTSTAGITNGEYLIVYEDASNATPAPVAFDGSLTTLDAASNNIAVTISSNTIAGNTDIDAAIFTIDATAKTIKSASGYYIGKTASGNGMNTSKTTAYTNTITVDANQNAVVKSSGNLILRYNKASDQKRFRYFGSGQEAIALYKKASKHTVTLADCTNGSVSAKMGETALVTNDQVLSGIQITLNNNPADNYKLVAYDVYKTGEESTKVTVTEGKFIMPEHEVTISATFEQLKELDKIEVNTTNVKTTFWQGEPFNSTGLVVTAYYTDETSTTVTPNSITGSTAEAGTKQVTVSYTEGDITKETKYDITVKAIANNEETPYTVTVAREIIDAVGETTVDVYVQGIVSKIVTAYNSEYGNISYNISEDGKTTSAQLQAYRGKSYNGEVFTSADDIQVDDKVVVKGKLKKHDTTYEFAQDNQLVSLVRSTEPKPTAATLPFEFDGNKDDIADVVGMSQTGLGTYDSSPKLKFDTENDNVIIHFDSEPGEFSFLLKQNGSSVGTFTVYESANGEDYTSVWLGGDLGGNGKSTTIKPTLSATSRYVKFEYTTKPSGTNYGLGSISIAKPDLRQEADIAWNPATVSLTVGDAFTAPTFTNPNGLSGITFASDNEDLATVTDAGVITMKEGVTGKAVITANFAGNEDYKSAEVTTTIIVSPETGDVVILAKHQGKWYAMKAEYPTIEGLEKTDRMAAVPVYYVNGKLYNVSEEDKAAITWTRSAYGDNTVSFQNNGKYLKGKSSTTLILEANEDDSYKWDAADNTMLIEGTTRTFLYHKDGFFRNYSITLARETSPTYSALPVVTAPEFATGNVYTINASATNGTAKGADTYVEGSTVTLMADPKMDHTFVNWTKGDEVVSTANPYVFEATKNVELVANFRAIPERTTDLTGTFSVGKYEVAQFATGNLQYNVKNKEWSFAKQQYQYIGDANINVGDPAFTGTIDLFGWSNGENNNFGANQSGNKNDYKGDFVDWGTLFPAEDNWSTLSHEQWDYLLNKRGAGKKQIARVGTVFGVMLFPDVWNAPLTVEAQYDNYFKINVYNYTLDQWTKLETAGAVFFPAAGRRYGGYDNKYIYDGITNLGDEYKLQYCTNDLAAYYTSTKHDDGERVSYLLNLGNGGAKYSTLELGWYEYGHVGQSVRLAKVTSTLVEIGDGDNTSVIEIAGEEVDVKVNRSFTKDKLYTISLPFALDAEQVKEIFGVGTIIYEFAKVTKEDEVVKLYFQTVSAIAAATPYLIKPAQNVNGFEVEDVTISTTPNNISFTAGATTIIMKPILSTTAGEKTNGTTEYWLAENTWLYNNANTIQSLRALFKITTVSGMPPRCRVALGENIESGVDNITSGDNTTNKVIENGQLFIIRNGEKFNTMGIKF